MQDGPPQSWRPFDFFGMPIYREVFHVSIFDILWAKVSREVPTSMHLTSACWLRHAITNALRQESVSIPTGVRSTA